MSKNVRVNITMPFEMANQLSVISNRMGITRSALTVQLLDEAVPLVYGIVTQLPAFDVPLDDSKVKRLRGESVAYIQEVFRDVSSKCRDELDSMESAIVDLVTRHSDDGRGIDTTSDKGKDGAL